MNSLTQTAFAMTLLAATCGLSSCVAYFDVVGYVQDTHKKLQGPEPESKWNDLRLWVKVQDAPPVYIPKWHPVSAARTENDGTWLTDKRDGKRFFVPNNLPPPLTTGLMLGEAKKITGNTGRSHWTVEPGILLMP